MVKSNFAYIAQNVRRGMLKDLYNPVKASAHLGYVSHQLLMMVTMGLSDLDTHSSYIEPFGCLIPPWLK